MKPVGSLWFIIHMIVGAAQQIQLRCEATGVCDYSSMALPTIPSGLTGDLLGLNLSSNHIERITGTDLKSAVNLKTLWLSSNRIQAIDADAFNVLIKLEHLDLSKNRLTHLSPSWFKYLSSLQYLNIKDNNYTDLGATPLFSSLQDLRYLYMGNDCCFSTLQKQDLEGISVLEELEIMGRHLKNYEPSSLKSIEHIRHIILTVQSVEVLFLIAHDVAKSVVCFELNNIHKFSGFNPDIDQQILEASVQKIVFRNVVLSDRAIAVWLLPTFYRLDRLRELELVDSKLYGTGDYLGITGQSYLRTVEVLTVRNLESLTFFEFSDLADIMLFVKGITQLTIENAKVFLSPCVLSQHFESLLYLDFSVNLLQDTTFEHSFCKGAWPKLTTLNVSQNSLTKLGRTAKSVGHLVNLTHLDISQNNFVQVPESCEWPKSLKTLNISGCKIHTLTAACIPQSLEVLDVSHNNLKDFTLSLPHLQELYITNNKLIILPSVSLIPNVRVLIIRENKLAEFSAQQLGKQMEKLDARYNLFFCSCKFLSFIQSQQGRSHMLVNWPESYICDSPSSVRGQPLAVAKLSLTECHRTLVVASICTLMLLTMMAVTILCYKLHVIWYMKMIWAWLQAKRKPQRAALNKDICYDAFISYSEHDSDWVENVMVLELEQTHPPFKLCLHKKDFLPGKWIVDNIIDSIEKSSKTLFVLSKHFVQSEWCKYELDFSHFRLFDENNDSAILILLEPIPEKTIPKRFCKLRKLMNTKTYLEWPRDVTQHPMFWFNLKMALKS